MRVTSKLFIAVIALATPLLIAAQAPPAPGPDGQGPGMGTQRRMGPGMGQQKGPGMGMRGERGMKMRRGMARRSMQGDPGLGMNRLLQDPAMRERLKITPEQVTKFQAQQSAMAKSGIRTRADIQVKRMELAELMRADNPDRALIDKKLREVQDASFAAEKASIDNHFAVQGLFTPEQRQEMEKLRSEFRGRMMHRGPGGPGGMGPRGPRPMGTPQQPPAPPPPDNNGR